MDKEFLEELLELAKLCKVLEERSVNISGQTAQIKKYLEEFQEKLYLLEKDLGNRATTNDIEQLRKQIIKLADYLKSDKIPHKKDLDEILVQWKTLSKILRKSLRRVTDLEETQEGLVKDVEVLKTNDSKIQNWLSTAKNVSWLIVKICSALVVISGFVAFYINYLKGD